jgi:tripartite-type tricarboxylate transporter receptor subunit TctC
MIKALQVAIVGLLAVVSLTATAQSFTPTNRVIEIVVPYPPGGATDKWGRTIDEIFRTQGWQSVVINKPGADTVIGSNLVAAARPDGHTLYVGGNGFIDANIAFKQKAPGIEYTENSFAPIVPLGAGTAVLAVGKNVPVNTYEEFLSYVKKNPEKFNLGFWNTYTGNIFYEWAKREGLPRPNMIFYKGSAPQVADILGGHIPFVFDTYTAMSQHFKAGNVKIIATLDRRGVAIVKRDQPQAQLVSIASRVSGVDVPIWYGLYAPAGTPAAVVDQINQVINTALRDPKFAQQIENLHIANFGGSAEDQRRVQTSVLNIMRNVSLSIEK